MLTITQAAERIGVHPNTLRAWVDRGLIPATRLPSGYRRFTLEQIEQIQRSMELEPDRAEDAGTR